MDMNKLLGNLNAIEEGTFEGPAKQQSDQMKRILESFDAVEGCGDPAPAPMSMPAPEDKGQPVSMNVNLNASGKENVEDLMALIKAATEMDKPMLAPMPKALPAPDQGEPEMSKLKAIMAPEMEEDELEVEGDYANEPEEEYKDTQYMTHDLAGGLNKEKKAYAKAQDGDNAMALEAKLKKELSSMYEAKKNGLCTECGKPSYTTLPEEKQKGVDGKVCWKGYKRMGTKKKGGKTVDNCVKM